MRLPLYGIALLTLLLSALPAFGQAGPQGLYFPGNQSGTGSNSFTNLHAGPGSISITGGSGNGTDQISSMNVNGVLNVQTYGARCDGTTDDRSAINNALAACGTTTNTAVEIPNLTCAVSGPVAVPSSCVFRGRGPQSRIVELASATFPAGNTALVVNTNAATSGDSNVSIRDLQITGAGNHSKTGNCITLAKVTGGDIDNVTCTNADFNGIMVDSSTGFKVRNTHTVAPQYFGIVIYNLTSSSRNFTITNNVEENTGGDSIFVALTPIPSVAGSVVIPSTDFSITGNLIKTAGDAGIEVGAVGNLNVQHTNFIVSNNEVDGSVNNGILLRDVAHFSVTGNTLKGNGTTGGAASQDEISVYAAEGYVNDGSIVGNHLWPTYGSGVGFAQGADLAGNKYTAYRIVVEGNSVWYDTKSYTCSGRNGVGVAVNLYQAGPPYGNNVSVIGNVLSNVPCQGVAAAGPTFANPLAGAIVQGNTIGGQTTTGTTGIYCAQASCSIQGNVLEGLATGINVGNSPGVILAGNQFLGAITTGYTITGSSFQPFDTNVSPLNLYKLGSVPPISPGGGSNCQMFVQAGTTAGSCKIQAICGSSLTPVTIIDNVGSGC